MKAWSETGGGISIPPANASAPVYSAPVNTKSPPANISMPVFTSPPSTETTTASASIPVIYILIGVIALIAIIALAVII
jgi:hypothetical protein